MGSTNEPNKDCNLCGGTGGGWLPQGYWEDCPWCFPDERTDHLDWIVFVIFLVCLLLGIAILHRLLLP